jgi:hypothetical protein
VPYGLLGGLLASAILAHVLGTQADAEMESLLAKADNTVFGLTFRRSTHPALMVIAIVIVIAMVGFIRGWWLE